MTATPSPRIRALVVDDEPLARRGIVARLARHADVEVVGECGSGREALAALPRVAPDVIFLDVQMPGVDGLAVAGEARAAESPLVVFVTAHERHAVQAFGVRAVDYLLKPIDDDRFDDAVGRVRTRVVERARERGMAAGAPAPTHAGGPRIVVHDRGRVLLVDAADVDWVGAEGDYVRLHVGQRSHLVRETMKTMERQLPPAAFARIHRSAIVNVARVRELRPRPNREYTVVLQSGARLRLSRSYRDQLARLLGKAG